MADFGYKPWNEYTSEHEDRYDVHSLAASLQRYVCQSKLTQPLHAALRAILNHIPDPVQAVNPDGTTYLHTTYLINLEHPVQDAASAEQAVLDSFVQARP